MDVYIEQYGRFWKMPLGAWIRLCKKAVDDSGYDLDEEGKLLAHRPRVIGEFRMRDGAVGYNAVGEGVIFRQPLDWIGSDFGEELDNLNKVFK